MKKVFTSKQSKVLSLLQKDKGTRLSTIAKHIYGVSTKVSINNTRRIINHLRNNDTTIKESVKNLFMLA